MFSSTFDKNSFRPIQKCGILVTDNKLSMHFGQINFFEVFEFILNNWAQNLSYDSGYENLPNRKKGNKYFFVVNFGTII